MRLLVIYLCKMSLIWSIVVILFGGSLIIGLVELITVGLGSILTKLINGKIWITVTTIILLILNVVFECIDFFIIKELDYSDSRVLVYSIIGVLIYCITMIKLSYALYISGKEGGCCDVYYR